MADRAYSTADWTRARERALARDHGRCTVGRLLGGDCNGALHVHHLVPLKEGGDPYALENLSTTCASHHPKWESLRRSLNEQRAPRRRRCPHRHVTAEARRLCEAKLNREKEWAFSAT